LNPEEILKLKGFWLIPYCNLEAIFFWIWKLFY